MRVLLALAIIIPTTSFADDETDHLRDALRHVTVDLRAAEDAQATLQAQLDEANKRNTLLEQQVAALNAKLTVAPAAPVIAPAVLTGLRSQLASARAQNGELRGGLARWQSAYQQAATIARQKDAESRGFSGTSAAEAKQLTTCEAANVKLTKVADEVLHLYTTQGFRSILLGSYEPLIGFDQVKLENIVQDYEDKIRAQAYIPPH